MLEYHCKGHNLRSKLLFGIKMMMNLLFFYDFHRFSSYNHHYFKIPKSLLNTNNICYFPLIFMNSFITR